MLVRELPASEKPREKLLKHGADTLSDAELLAILLRVGTRGTSVIELAQQMLTKHGGLQSLLQLERSKFCDIKGMGLTKYAQLQAALALAQRCIEQQLITQPSQLNSPGEVHNYIRMQLATETREVFAVLYLDNANRMVHFCKLFSGSLTQAQVDPGEVFRLALEHRASRLIICHNHPSGDPTPSNADDNLTRQIATCGRILDIELLDHLVVGKGRYYSYASSRAEILKQHKPSQ